MATRDEIMKFVVNVEGKKDVEGMGKAFDAVGKAADNADPAAKKLMDDLERIGRDKSAVENMVKLKAQLTETREKLAQAVTGLEALRKEFGNADGSSAKVTKAFAAAEKAVADLTKAERLQSVELQKTSGALAKAGIDATRLAEADRRLTDEGRKVADGMRLFAAAATAAGKGARDAAAGVDELNKQTKEAKGGSDGLIGSLAKIAPLAAALGVAFKGVQLGADAFAGAAGIEQSLARVQALAEGTAEEFARLGGVVQQAAREARVAPEVAAQALAELAGQGQSADAAIKSLIPTLRLAKIAQIEVGAAAGAVDDVLDLFGLSAEDAARAVDVLVAASKGSDEGLQGLLGAFSKIAPSAREAGYSFEQLAGLMAVFAQNGFSAEKASKGLLKIFDDLRDPTSQLRQDLSDLGDNSGDFTTAITTLAGAGDKSKKALDNLDASARNLVLFLLQQGDGAIENFTAGLLKAEGTASKVAKAIDDNLKSAFTNATAAFDNLATAFLLPILAPLKAEIEKVTVAFDQFAQTPAFKTLQDALLQFVTTGLTALREFFGAIDFTTLGQNLANFGTNAGAFFTELRTGLSDTARFIGNTLNGIGVVFDSAAAVVHAAAAAIAGALGGVAKAAAYLSELDINDKLTSQLEGVESNAEKLNTIADALLESARTNYDQTGASIGSLVENLDQLVTGLDATSEPAAAAADSMSAIGAAAAALPEQVAGAAQGTEQLGKAVGELPAQVAPAAAAVDKLKVAINAVSPEVQAARDRLAAAKAALLELNESANATPEALAKANAELQAATFHLQKVSAATKDSKEAADKLAKAYTDLGIVSQADLEEKALKAANALEEVTRAQQRGAAATEDVRRAFVAMAQAQLAAAADSDTSARARVEAEIRVQAAALGVVDSLEKLGLAGKKAGADVAAGADQASTALADVDATAQQAATSAQNLGQSSNTAATGLNNAAAAGHAAAESALGVSAAFADAAQSILGLDRVQFNIATEQQEQFNLELEQAKKRRAMYDEREQALERLRKKYTALNDAQLQLLLNEQMAADQAEKRKQQEQTSTSTAGGGGSMSGTLNIVLHSAGKAGTSQVLTVDDIQRLKQDPHVFGVLTRALADGLTELAKRGGFEMLRKPR